MSFKTIRTALICTIVCCSYQSIAQAKTCTDIGKVVSSRGYVRVQRAGDSNWQFLKNRETICDGDTIKTGYRSRAAVALNNESVMRINQRTSTKLENFSTTIKSGLRVLSGIIHMFSRKPRSYTVGTRNATIGIRGTEYVVEVKDGETLLTVFEGKVEVVNDVAPIDVVGGQSVRVVSGQAIQYQTLVSPRDQVQWGLYYPPVLAVSDLSDEQLKSAAQCGISGDYQCAFDYLDKVPAESQGSEFKILNAALLLAVGNPKEATEIIDQADLSNNASALALKSVISVTQNRVDDALAQSSQALEADPDSATALIARSYALQAALDLEGAESVLNKAVTEHPDNALAWARTSEILLALGERSYAFNAAQRAVKIDPQSARAYMVLGYAALSEFDTDEASVAFDKALTLDAADPLAHLGAGLALINQGDLVEGRREIEAAVALDSSSAILRTYLGRAYFEENRTPLDADQYAMAKQLDPNDPTAYLFDAISKHAANRPVEALADVNAAIEKNDNRAVYRSGLLLDQDRAARSASLARVYDTLGFPQQGALEASHSLAIDPANASAHRFMSDSYRNVRRHEIGRVSELLQAQMLQTVNMNPVQPSISATRLNIGSGAGDVGLNEFTGLFESNGLQPAISVGGGNLGTHKAEAIVSGLYDGFSFSLGAMTYETDGWRDNNGLEQDVANLFVQWAVTPTFNIQAEIGTQETTEGDLAFRFDPADFDSTLTRERDNDTARIGLRYSPSNNSHFLASYIESDIEEDRAFTGDDLALVPNPLFNPADPVCASPTPIPIICFIPVVPGLVQSDLTGHVKDEGEQSELQYIHRFDKFNFVLGYANTDVDSTLTTTSSNPTSLTTETNTLSELEHKRAYLYSTIALHSTVDLTLGISSDDYEEATTDESKTNGKFGLVWQPNEQHKVRLAWFELMKPALVSNRSLEPTQVAGFNQYLDNINGSQSEVIGFGYNLMLSSTLNIGFEATSRDIDEPFISSVFTPSGPVNTTVFEERSEDMQQFYINWSPTNSITVNLEVINDTFDAEVTTNGLVESGIIPEEVDTLRIPLGIRYFSPVGWYAGLTVTHVDQEVVSQEFVPPGPPAFIPSFQQVSNEDDFNLVDIDLGYRLPKRWGSLSVAVKNATDEQFNYLDDTYRETRDVPSIGPYFPVRTYYIQANIVF